MAGRAPAKREALWDAGGLCFPGDRGHPASADGQAEESAAAGAEGQSEFTVFLFIVITVPGPGLDPDLSTFTHLNIR